MEYFRNKQNIFLHSLIGLPLNTNSTETRHNQHIASLRGYDVINVPDDGGVTEKRDYDVIQGGKHRDTQEGLIVTSW